jgi:hypothetical protein
MDSKDLLKMLGVVNLLVCVVCMNSTSKKCGFDGFEKRVPHQVEILLEINLVHFDCSKLR